MEQAELLALTEALARIPAPSGGGAHTTEEYLLPDSIPAGIEVIKQLLASYL